MHFCANIFSCFLVFIFSCNNIVYRKDLPKTIEQIVLHEDVLFFIRIIGMHLKRLPATKLKFEMNEWWPEIDSDAVLSGRGRVYNKQTIFWVKITFCFIHQNMHWNFM